MLCTEKTAGKAAPAELGGESSNVGTNADAGVPSRPCGGRAKITEALGGLGFLRSILFSLKKDHG